MILVSRCAPAHRTITAIGVDNVFLLMAAFRGTDRQDDLEERVGQAMRESCISILIAMATGAFVCAAHTHV